MSIDRNDVHQVLREESPFSEMVEGYLGDIPHDKGHETPVATAKEKSSEASVRPFGPQSRCEVEPRDLHLYPTQKEGQTTKDRRYNPRVKESDKDKIHGKLKGGRSHKQLKKSGLSPTHND